MCKFSLLFSKFQYCISHFHKHTHTLHPCSKNILPFPAKSASNATKRIMPSFSIVLKSHSFRLCWWQCQCFIYTTLRQRGGVQASWITAIYIFRRCLIIRKTRDLPESNFNLLLRLVASKTVTFRTLFSIFPTLANILRWFTQSYEQCASSNINKTFV